MQVTTEQCEFDKKSKVLYFHLREGQWTGKGRFPREIELTSSHTGRVVKFIADDEAAVAAEWWDGEMYEYVPVTPLPNVRKLVII